jgi:hypothetical protein
MAAGSLIDRGGQPLDGVAGAPAPHHEVSQPLVADAGAVVYADGGVMRPIERARANEQELQPLTYGRKVGEGATPLTPAAPQVDPFYQQLAARRATPPRPPQVPAPPASPAAAPLTVPRIRRSSRLPMPPVPTEVAPAAPVAAPVEAVIEVAPPPPPPPVLNRPPALTDADRARMPAASDSDSPAAGVLRGHIPAGKEITGGFTDGSGLQYFPLNGQELFTLVESLMDQIHARCKNDLRFNEALCYPQVTARVLIEVQGFVHDSDFTIQQVLPTTHDAVRRTPIEVARLVADEVCFVLIEEQRETDDTGQSATPPDQIREGLGLQRPRKRRITSGRGDKQFVDVV